VLVQTAGAEGAADHSLGQRPRYSFNKWLRTEGAP